MAPFFFMQTTTQDTVNFYVTIMRASVEGLLNVVCEANAITRTPTSTAQLCKVPVYEVEFAKSLLSMANERADTNIRWPESPQFEFLQAYFKRYRRNGRRCNEIVVCTTNYCWARFYAAKELMHCFLDDDGYPASDSNALVDDLLESLAAGGFAPHREYKPQTIIDEVAWIGALEYVLPASWMPTIAELISDLAAEFPDQNAHLYVAQILRVPELILRYRLKFDQPNNSGA